MRQPTWRCKHAIYLNMGILGGEADAAIGEYIAISPEVQSKILAYTRM